LDAHSVGVTSNSKGQRKSAPCRHDCVKNNPRRANKVKFVSREKRCGDNFQLSARRLLHWGRNAISAAWRPVEFVGAFDAGML